MKERPASSTSHKSFEFALVSVQCLSQANLLVGKDYKSKYPSQSTLFGRKMLVKLTEATAETIRLPEYSSSKFF